MLAPEDDDPRIDTPRFSLASEIVELVVLTVDNIFLQTLREAVGPSRRLWHVLSPDKVSDLMLAGGVGILVLDAQVLSQGGASFIAQMKRQFPDLVIVVAGTRDTEIELARLISDGSVYRFIHKPMSPARARLFADAAVKRYDEHRRRTSPAAAALPGGNRPLMIAGACASICAIAMVVWSLTRADRHGAGPAAGQAADSGSGADAAAPPPVSAPTLSAADTQLLAHAAEALSANRLVAPSGDNALELYLREQARNPGNAEARSGIATVRERLLAHAESALLEERLDEAAAAIETARRAGVESGRISLLAAELAKARVDLKAADAARAGAAPSSPGPSDPAAASAALALDRIADGRLIEPEHDSARFYVREALRLNPDSGAAERASEALALGLLDSARSAIDRGDLATAAIWLDAAEGIASRDNVKNLRQTLAAAQRSAAAESMAGTAKPEKSAATTAAPQAEPTGAAAPAPAAASAEADVIDASRLAVVSTVQPEYPRKAREAAIEGWVELEFTIAPSGQVKDLSVRAASPHGMFDQAALDAVSQWRYQPLNGGGVAGQRALIRIRFALAH